MTADTFPSRGRDYHYPSSNDKGREKDNKTRKDNNNDDDDDVYFMA